MAVFIGGGLGSLARWGLSAVSNRALGQPGPWGTLVVNVIGCFAIGLLVPWLLRQSKPTNLEALLVTGVLGGFTTFSAFAFQSADLYGTGQVRLGTAYLALSVGLCLIASATGLTLGGYWRVRGIASGQL